MTDENNTTSGSDNNQGSNSGNTGNGNNSSGNDREIPYVPPQGRTNLNEHIQPETKPVIPPSTKKGE